jgi:hypothetical protein
MHDVLEWLKYDWKFDYQIGMYWAFCARLAGTPARVEDLLRGLPEDKLRHKPLGKWSLKEQAGHLWTIEDFWQTRFEQYRRGETRLEAADMSNRKTDEGGFNEKTVGEILGAFRKARARTMELLDGLTLQDASRVAEHPRLEMKIRLIDHCHFVAEHDDHHLAVMRNMLRS